MSYVLIDATEGSILGRAESVEDFVRIVLDARREQPGRELRIGRFEEHQGELVGTRSIVTARFLGVSEGLATFGRHGRRRRHSR